MPNICHHRTFLVVLLLRLWHVLKPELPSSGGVFYLIWGHTCSACGFYAQQSLLAVRRAVVSMREPGSAMDRTDAQPVELFPVPGGLFFC